MKFAFLIVFSTIFSSIYSSYDVTGHLETYDCIITFLKKDNGKDFVLKQIKGPHPEQHFLLVLDVLGNTIAESVGIPVNHVELVVPGTKILDKTLEKLATLHTKAAGEDLEHSKKYYQLDIHQRMRLPWSELYEKYGPLKPERTGLTPTVIAHMSLHPDLPPLVAVDTFTNNSDRSCPNIFYDEQNDRFCGIDMAAIYSKNLCKEACRQIQFFKENNIIFSETELQALRSYCFTLEKLLEKYSSSEEIVTLFLNLARQAGFYPGSTLYTGNIAERIPFYQRMIRESFEDAIKLVDLLKELLYTKK